MVTIILLKGAMMHPKDAIGGHYTFALLSAFA